MRSFAATFIDVEADFTTTGIGFGGAQNPRLHFPEQPTTHFAFLGIALKDPVTSLAIRFATGASIDGVLVDDVRYALQGGVKGGSFRVIASRATAFGLASSP